MPRPWSRPTHSPIAGRRPRPRGRRRSWNRPARPGITRVPERPVDVAFEVAGDDGALADAIRAVRPGGRVVLVGIPSGDRTTFAAGVARRKGISMLLCRRMQPADLPRATALVAAGSIDLTRLISDRFPIHEASQAFAALVARRGLKVVVTPDAALCLGRGRDGGRGLLHRCRLRDRVCARAPRRRRRRTPARDRSPCLPQRRHRRTTSGARRGRRPAAGLGAPGPRRLPGRATRHDPRACSRTRGWIRHPSSGSASTSRPARCCRPPPTARRSVRWTDSGATHTPG